MTDQKKQSTPVEDPELKLSLDNVPVDGALGLLAYGDIGIVAWRNKRTEVEGPDWRAKLAKELRTEEETLNAGAEGADIDVQS